MDTKRNDLTARNFPTAEEDAQAVPPVSRYSGPESAYRLAFTDVEFLLQDELRPVRMQLELLKPEMVQKRLGIESTIVLFGSARIPAPEAAARALADA
ncbi:MAG: 3-isopropylmalate dehydrogenase, partial [Burkholderiales bacterium]|nr:3-isopropylmalate dehydrogenase [Burkholderiales bacterium]